ncbi:hypothetical protein [Paludibaculum fermentans]|uniref:hypothetical protein n=1 Tax=Paludibaculum fermentans TaxID=1473598 RepID=UPI003EC090A9
MLLPVVAMRAQDLAGHYVLRGAHEVGSELLLKPDGRFEYMLAYGAADYSARGSWKRQEGVVVLNTQAPVLPPFRMVKGESNKEEFSRVWVKAANGQPVPHIRVAVKAEDDVKESKTSNEGAALFPRSERAREVMFSVPVYGLEAGPFRLDPAQNEYYFEINGEAITTVRFKDEKMVIDGKDLILRYWGGDRPMRYERQ